MDNFDIVGLKEKIKSFVEQVRNPYHFRVGKVKVRVSYADTDNTLNDSFARLLAII